jgi:hypothetical protein
LESFTEHLESFREYLESIREHLGLSAAGFLQTGSGAQRPLTNFERAFLPAAQQSRFYNPTLPAPQVCAS